MAEVGMEKKKPQRSSLGRGRPRSSLPSVKRKIDDSDDPLEYESGKSEVLMCTGLAHDDAMSCIVHYLLFTLLTSY